MAFTNDTVTSVSNLIDKLDIFMTANGWTAEHKDLLTTAGTGGEWAMRRTSGATNIRFAASWDAANSGEILSLYQYSDQNYVIGDRPWGQDHDSGNGFAGTTPDSSLDNERHVNLGSAPKQFWAYEDDDYTHIVVEISTNNYVHFGWGMLDKFGATWTGGEYCYGQKDNTTAFTINQIIWDEVSYLLDGQLNDVSQAATDMELFAATIHCESLPNQTANSMWAVSMGGKTAGAAFQTVFGNDRQSNDGASSDEPRVLFTWGLRAGPFVGACSRMNGTDISGHTSIWPVAPSYVDTTTGDVHGSPIGQMKDIGGINIKDWVAGDSITIGGDVWRIFPAEKKWISSEASTSSWLGIAYKEVA